MTGRKADVCKAAYLAAEIAHRMVVPGGEVCMQVHPREPVGCVPYLGAAGHVPYLEPSVSHWVCTL